MRKRTSIIWKIEKEKLQEVVSKCSSLTDILKYFGFAHNGTMHSILKRRFAEDGINYSHIKVGLNCNKGRKFAERAISLESVMTEHSTYDRGHLKDRLLKNGMLENKCQICGQLPEWQGKPMVLILDHINGVNDDNRKENLRLVCGNCNSQLETHCGKHKRVKHNCLKCGKQICKSSAYCSKCADVINGFKQRKVERPSKEELEKLVSSLPMIKVGEIFKVSDNAIRKWCKSYGITLERRLGFWTGKEY